jgi:SAM-dependent methyltransferase
LDLVVLCEVAEHLPTYIPVIGEIGRVLAPSGRLILSTPNVARLHSRWHFFWTGTHKLIRRRVGWDLKADDLYAYHVSPVDFPLLHTLLRQAGLTVERLDVTRFKWRHAWLFLLYPFVRLATRLETRKHRAGDTHAAGEEDLFRWMTKPAMLGSEQLLLTAKKGEA